jgi:adenylate cyclase
VSRPDPGPDSEARPGLVAQLEAVLLGDTPCFTRRQVVDRSGVPLEEARRLWQAMGFPEVGDDEAAFTEGDARALQLATELVREGLLDDTSRLALTRALGQSMSRLAEAAVEQLQSALGGQVATEQVVGLAGAAVPKVQRLLVHVWRRHLAAAAVRRLAGGADARQHQLAVCFADLSGFTGISRELSDRELAQLVERFEDLAANVVAAAGGRIVKTVGDEVMFVAAEPVAAAQTALDLVDGVEADELLPPVRAGMAYGTVLTRVGDVYGTVVNLAARLTSIARPGTVLADLQLAEALDGDGRFDLHRTRRRSVRGFPHLQPVRVKPADRASAGR